MTVLPLMPTLVPYSSPGAPIKGGASSLACWVQTVPFRVKIYVAPRLSLGLELAPSWWRAPTTIVLPSMATAE